MQVETVIVLFLCQSITPLSVAAAPLCGTTWIAALLRPLPAIAVAVITPSALTAMELTNLVA